jgi:pyrrolidone-carboxylate peptidase
MPRVSIHITGFGKFQGVDDNPTTELIKDLPTFISQNPLQVRIVPILILNFRRQTPMLFHLLC